MFFMATISTRPSRCRWSLWSFFLLKGGVTYLQNVILDRIGNNIVARYQRRLFDHLLSLDVDFFSKQHSATLVSRLNQNVLGIRHMLNTVILGYVRDLVTLIGLIGVMFYRDLYMSAAVFIVGPLALFVLAKYARRVKVIARQEVQINASVSTAMQEASHGISVIKAFTMEDQLRGKLNALTEEAEKKIQQNRPHYGAHQSVDGNDCWPVDCCRDRLWRLAGDQSWL